ncbi:MAG: hypothetical protein ACREL1_04505 [bacterium]
MKTRILFSTVLYLLMSAVSGCARDLTPIIKNLAVPTPSSTEPAATAFPSVIPILSNTEKPVDSVQVVPNPLGDKIIFRVVVAEPSSVKIMIYDHFFAPVMVLKKTGQDYFDVLWKVKKVSEGIYYFKSQIQDSKTGVVLNLPAQKVIVSH